MQLRRHEPRTQSRITTRGFGPVGVSRDWYPALNESPRNANERVMKAKVTDRNDVVCGVWVAVTRRGFNAKQKKEIADTKAMLAANNGTWPGAIREGLYGTKIAVR